MPYAVHLVPYALHLSSGDDVKKLTDSLFILIATWITLWISPVHAEIKPKASGPVNVKIISIHEGQTVHGLITIEAVVSNPSAVHYLDFYFQEPGARDRYGWKDYSSPYFWGGDGQRLDTTLFNDGPASVVAFCHAYGMKKPVSEHRLHFTIDNGKPIVKILEPKNEGEISGKALIQIRADDRRGLEEKAGISSVYIYMDGALLAKLTEKPFECELNTCLMTSGRHSILAVAEDNEKLTTMDRIVVNVGTH